MALDFARIWQEIAHPVFNGFNHKIGYFVDDAQLARGQLQLYSGESAGNAADWLVLSPLGVTVSAATYLVNKGLQPAWLTHDAAVQVYNQTSNWLGRPGPISAPDVVGAASPSSDIGASAGLTSAQALMIGGGGLLAILLIKRLAR